MLTLGDTPSATFKLTPAEVAALIDLHDQNSAVAESLQCPEASEHHAQRSEELKAMQREYVHSTPTKEQS